MLKGKRRKTMSSFGSDGRRIGGGGGLGLGSTFSRKRPLGARSLSRPSTTSDTAIGIDTASVPVSTFGKRRGGAAIQRAPVMCGLSVMLGSAGLLKPFQRPMMGRRAYKGKEDELLKTSSLGARRSTGGMQRLLSRAGKGLHFVGKRRKRQGDGDNTDESSDEEDNKEEDRPFEPLMVWNSPFQGGEPKGLPSTT